MLRRVRPCLGARMARAVFWPAAFLDLWLYGFLLGSQHLIFAQALL